MGEDYDCAVEAGIFQYMLHRHGVGDSAIKVEMPVELDNRGDKRQRRAGAYGVQVEGRILDGEIVGGAKNNIGDGDVELEGVGLKRLIIKGVDVILDVIEQEVVAHHASAFGKRLGAYVTRVAAKGEVQAIAAANLLGFEVDAVKSTGRYAIAGIDCDALLQEDVEHAGCKLPAEAAAFKYQSGLSRVVCFFAHRGPFSKSVSGKVCSWDFFYHNGTFSNQLG